MSLFHSSRAAQKAVCRAECDDDHHCYLGDNDLDCVIGSSIPGPNPDFKCCMVNKTNAVFIRTVRDILVFAATKQDEGTQRPISALTQLMNEMNVPIIAGGLSRFTTSGNTTGYLLLNTVIPPLPEFQESMNRELIDLTERLLPITAYLVSCNYDTLVGQRESRRRKKNIVFSVVLPPGVDNVLNIAANLRATVHFRMSPGDLVLRLNEVLRSQQPVLGGEPRQIVVYIANPLSRKMNAAEFEEILGLLETTSFRGTVSIFFVADTLTDIGVTGGDIHAGVTIGGVDTQVYVDDSHIKISVS